MPEFIHRSIVARKKCVTIVPRQQISCESCVEMEKAPIEQVELNTRTWLYTVLFMDIVVYTNPEMFAYFGVHSDKHVRKYDVYEVLAKQNGRNGILTDNFCVFRGFRGYLSRFRLEFKCHSTLIPRSRV
jgi:hypothetical protein